MSDPAGRIDQLARSAALAVAARAVNVIGVPAVLGLMFWLFSTVSGLEKEVAKLPVMFESMKEQIGAANRRIDGHDQRIQRLEEPFFRGRN